MDETWGRLESFNNRKLLPLVIFFVELKQMKTFCSDPVFQVLVVYYFIIRRPFFQKRADS